MNPVISIDPAKPWPIMVLAHNEERHIVNCIDSIFASGLTHAVEVYVMANGCTDSTERLVSEYSARRPEVKLVSIKLGDKCNAWNIFIHETVVKVCPDRSNYFFVDGDARFIKGSFDAMAQALRMEPHAHACSAPPSSGRSMVNDRRLLIEQRDLVANLYALRGEFVHRLVAGGVRMPLKLEGDDGLLGALIKWDLDPKKDHFDDLRIVACPEAGFVFESMQISSFGDVRSYWKRAVRYGRRTYEFQLLGKRLRAKGMSGLPRDIREIWGEARQLRLKWQGLYTVTNWFALREMRGAANFGP